MRQRDQKDQDRRNAGGNVHGLEEQTLEGFIDDVEGGEYQQPGLDEGGEIFEFAVAIGMALVGRLVGNTDR